MAIITDLILGHLRKSAPALVLISVNLVFFMAVRLSATAGEAREVVESLGLSQSANELLSRPWTPLTYMFTHVDFTHLFFNMVWLGIAAAVLTRMCPRRSVYVTFVIAGLAGAVVFIIIAAPGQFLIGASCAVFGLLSAMATSVRRLPLELPIVGHVNAAALVFVLIFLHLVYIYFGSSVVAASHLAGIAAGIVCAVVFRHQAELASDTVAYDATLEQIRNKITTSGYASLSPEEKRLIENQTNSQS